MELNDFSKITPLCKIAAGYGTDKCPQIKHSYTPFYYSLWSGKRKEIRKVLELGIGHYKDMDKNATIFDSGLKRIYHKGASLYMWRDFFPNATIYGADNWPQAIFQDNRIKTFLVDERNGEDLGRLVKQIGPDIDIVIDDASHKANDQIFAAKTLLPLLNDRVSYIIEDVSDRNAITESLSIYDIAVPQIPTKWKDCAIIKITKPNGIK